VNIIFIVTKRKNGRTATDKNAEKNKHCNPKKMKKQDI